MKPDPARHASSALLPLAGVRVIELAAIGPLPFASNLLRQLGASVTVIESPHERALGLPVVPEFDYLARGKQSCTLDLKSPSGRADLFALLADADVLLEGFRPGTMERLELSTSTLHAIVSSLIIGRCSGWGATSPRRQSAGHDINFLALAGALGAIGTDAPTPPLNLVGDYGGAAMHLVTGVLAALLQRQRDGLGCVVDTSIFEGTTALMTLFYGLTDAVQWQPERSANTLDGGAPYYRCYATLDGKWMALGAIEAKFFAQFVAAIGAQVDLARQHDRSYWPHLNTTIGTILKQRTQQEWDTLFRATDCCCTPVLELPHARSHADVQPLFDGALPKCPITFTRPERP